MDDPRAFQVFSSFKPLAVFTVLPQHSDLERQAVYKTFDRHLPFNNAALYNYNILSFHGSRSMLRQHEVLLPRLDTASSSHGLRI